MEKEGALDNQISKLAKKFIEISKDEEVLVKAKFIENINIVLGDRNRNIKQYRQQLSKKLK